MGKHLGIAAAAMLVMCAPLVENAQAVPELGVASSYGYVNATDDYQTYWGGTISGPAGEDGFMIGPSGSELSVFTRIANADIYILTTSDVGTGNAITFNGSVNVYANTGTFRSYSPTPYYGVNLGAVNSGWSALPSDPFTPGNYYSLGVTVDYTGTLSVDNWIFAAADDNGLAGLQAKSTTAWVDDNGLAGTQQCETAIWVDSNDIPGIQEKGGKFKVTCPDGKGKCQVTYDADSSTVYLADSFSNFQGDSSSPKTTSARGGYSQVPEPGTIYLLGSGLLGFGFFRLRKRTL